MNLQRYNPAPQCGLTQEQVQRQVAQGLQNTQQDKITRSTGQIFKENICTLFNLFNIVIAIALALVGAWSNLLFIGIIALNTLIGILQELRAKKLVDELCLLSVPVATVVREGKQQKLPVEELVLWDIMLLESGEQICTDAVVLDGEIEVNEALLTGESDAVIKRAGDHLLSGSFVISGKSTVQVEHVGSENFAARLAAQAKKHKKVNSELLRSMRKVTRFTGFFILPLGIVLFLEALFLRGDILADAVVSTAAGLLGMLPKGLVLLISIGLAVGVIRLAKRNVMVQSLYSLETLAHVDTLCLDKTGTLTEGKMSVEGVYPLGQCPKPFAELMGSFLHHTHDNNASFQALNQYFDKNTLHEPVQNVPFSSERKWSAMTFATGTLVLGAPERLMQGDMLPEVAEAVQSGKRVLLAGWTEQAVQKNQPLPPVQPLQAIVLSDPVRKTAAETLRYFKQEGLDIKVISGDNPATVAAVAREACLDHADACIDMTGVESPADIASAAEKYTVFGRVSPQQKKQLVCALQASGHSVAMTGDGVNDILALREAHCSIAIGSGSDAARQVSQLVLLDSDFSALTEVLAQGRRVVNNITRVASVFFVKTIYSILLSIICVLFNVPFPFLPIQITMIDLIIEGYPAFFMSFEPDDRKMKGRFLPTVLRKALPNALTIVILAIILPLVLPHFALDAQQMDLLLYLLLGFVGILAVFKACVPFNKLRVFLFVTMTVGFFVAVLLFHSLLELPMLTLSILPAFLVCGVIAVALERIFNWLCSLCKGWREK